MLGIFSYYKQSYNKYLYIIIISENVFIGYLRVSKVSRYVHLPKCPSTDEWVKKMWHIYTMEYYSAIKRNEIELFVLRWMDLESVIQSEVSQKEKNKYHMLTHIYGI